ncbi:MAG TPA: helix-turn-helix transcriptional regulator [Pseudonocardiaceae bacterium]|nr:helix-turn-helix transcriptional regulator [Pseudonocardiaceae bacterium]
MPYTPVAPTFGPEIRAATAVEFATLLRLLQIRSGVSASEIARRAGIARSQAYALINSGRRVLPTHLPQVAAFTWACGLPPDLVAQVERLWVRLQESAVLLPVDDPPAADPPASAADPPAADNPPSAPAPLQDNSAVTTALPHAPPNVPLSGTATTPEQTTRESQDASTAGNRVSRRRRQPDIVAELVEELKVLRRGRAILEGRIEDRIGRALRVACGIPDGAGSTEIRRLLSTRLTELADQLPDDLRKAVLATFALLPDTRQRFYQERVRWLANQLERDERTAQRRINEGIVHLAELAAASIGSLDDRGSGDHGPAWYTEKIRVSLVLDQPNPEAFEWRRIVSNRDGLTELDLAFTLTAPQALDGTHEAQLRITMLYGGTLVMKEMPAAHRFSFAVVLPRPLSRGEPAEFALRFVVPDSQAMQPHYVCVPRERCALFDLRVRFDRDRLPLKVWQLSKAFQHELEDPGGEGEIVELDAAGELHLRFDELHPGFAYGARWAEDQSLTGLVPPMPTATVVA